MLDKIKRWFIYDPKAKQKIIFIIIASLIIGVFTYFLFLLNFSPEPETLNNSTEQAVEEEEREEIPDYDFDLSSFSRVFNKPIGLASSVYFSEFNDQIYYLNEDFKLVAGDREIQDSPVFTNLYNIQENREAVILNQQDFSTFFSKVSQSFRILPEGALSVIPFQDEFYFLEIVNDRIDLKKSSNILLQRPERVLTIRPDMRIYRGLELRELNNRLYIFVYEKGVRQGELEIWKTEGRNATQIYQISGLVSHKFSKNQFLYTKVENNNHRTSVLDFSHSSSNGNADVFQISNQGLVSRGVFGNILAHRCQISSQATNIYCPVKIDRVAANDPRYPDEVVILNYINQNTFLPFTENLFTSISHIILSPNEELYFISQTDRILYEIDTRELFF